MKYLFIFLVFFSCVACNNDYNNQDQASKERVQEDQGLLQTGNDDVKPNDEILLESREEINADENQDPLHPTQAEHLVREKLGLEKNEDMIVQYDHLEDGNYIIHVYSVNGGKENSEAWYIVEMDTGKVKPLEQ